MRTPIRIALVVAVTCAVAAMPAAPGGANDAFDPLLDGGAICTAQAGGPPAVLRTFILAKAETAPFQPVPAKPAMGEAPVLYTNLGTLTFKAGTTNAKAQAWFDQGLILAFGFNHAEAQRAFREAQKLDPRCALCFWGESLVLGPNINVPMMPEANPPALAALAKAVELAPTAPSRDRALIEALAKRYSDDPKAERAALDKAYADAMQGVAARFPTDDTVQVLVRRGADGHAAVGLLGGGGHQAQGQRRRHRRHARDGAEAQPRPSGRDPPLHPCGRGLGPARESAGPARTASPRLIPGAGHLVHMPAHIYYRVGMYRESLEINKRAIAVDERYFRTSPSDPLYKSAYYPHNIHFVMVSAQVGGDGRTAIEAAGKLDAAVPVEVVRQFAIMQPIKAAPYTTHAQFSDPDTILTLPAPPPDLVVVTAMYHYARALAFAARKDTPSAQKEIDALAPSRARVGLQAFRGVVAAGEGNRADRAAGRAGAPRRRQRRPRGRPRRPTRRRCSSRTRSRTWSRPTGTTRSGSRSVRPCSVRASSTRRRSCSAIRSAASRNNGWALAGLAETYKRKGDANAEKAARRAFAKAWFGNPGGPAIERL